MTNSDPFASGELEPISGSGYATSPQSQAGANLKDPFATGELTPVQTKVEPKSVVGELGKLGKAMWELTPSAEEFVEAGKSPISMIPGGIVAKLMYDKPQRFDVALNVGLPLAVQAITAPLAPIGVQAAAGAGASAVADAITQARRIATGEQTGGFSWGEVGQSAALGAVPVVGIAGTAAKAARPIMATAKATAKTAGLMAGAGAAGQVIKTAIDARPMTDDNGNIITDEQGKPVMTRIPDTNDVIVSAAIPAVTTIALSPLSFYAARNTDVGRSILIASQDIPESVRPTIGMLRKDLARVEQRAATYGGSGSKAAKAVQQSYEDFEKILGTESINPPEAAVVFEEVSPLLRKVSDQKEVLDSLSKEAQQAGAEADAAYDAWKSARLDEYTAKKQAYIDANGRAFAERMNSAVANQRLIKAEIAAGDNPLLLDPVSAQRMAVDGFAKPVEAAVDSIFDGAYRVIETGSGRFPVGTLKSFVDEARSTNRAMTPAVEGAMRYAEDFANLGTANIGEVRTFRNRMLNMAKSATLSADEKSIIRELAHESTDLMDRNAKSVLGESRGQLLLDTNKDYARVYGRDGLYHQPGVEAFFDKGYNGGALEAMVNDMLRKGNGTNSQLYKNAKAYADFLGEFMPNQKNAALEHLHGAIKGRILQNSSNYSAAADRMLIDPVKLADNLESLASSEGAVETLGLGNKANARTLIQLAQDFPDAAKMTADQWMKIINNPQTQALLNRENGLAMVLRPILAESDAKNKLYTSALLANAERPKNLPEEVGEKISKAEVTSTKAAKLRDEAFRELESINANMDEAKKLYDSYIADDSLRVLSHSNIDAKDMQQLDAAIFGTQKMSKETAKEVMDAIRAKNPKGARDIEEWHIASALGDLRESSPTYFTKRPFRTNVEELAKMGDSASASWKWNKERLDALISPDLMDKVDEAVSFAQHLAEYEREGGRPYMKASAVTGEVGKSGKLLDVAQRLWYTLRYKMAAREISGRAEAESIGASQYLRGQGQQMGAIPAGAVISKEAEREESERNPVVRFEPGEETKKAAQSGRLNVNITQQEEAAAPQSQQAEPVLFRPPAP